MENQEITTTSVEVTTQETEVNNQEEHSLQTTTESVSEGHTSEQPTTTQILTGVGVQVLNILIFFVVFWLLVGKKVVKGFEERKNLMKKLENAEENYKKRLQDAEDEAKKILQEGLKRKDEIIAEAGSLASQRKDEILQEAHIKAEKLIEEAVRKNDNLRDELEKQFEAGVKKTSLSVLKKLIDKDPSLKGEYLDSVVKEVVK